jgi:hypothetical protein
MDQMLQVIKWQKMSVRTVTSLATDYPGSDCACFSQASAERHRMLDTLGFWVPFDLR